jgi:hypothetical protein
MARRKGDAALDDWGRRAAGSRLRRRRAITASDFSRVEERTPDKLVACTDVKAYRGRMKQISALTGCSTLCQSRAHFFDRVQAYGDRPIQAQVDRA